LTSPRSNAITNKQTGKAICLTPKKSSFDKAIVEKATEEQLHDSLDILDEIPLNHQQIRKHYVKISSPIDNQDKEILKEPNFTPSNFNPPAVRTSTVNILASLLAKDADDGMNTKRNGWIKEVDEGKYNSEGALNKTNNFTIFSTIFGGRSDGQEITGKAKEFTRNNQNSSTDPVVRQSIKHSHRLWN